MNWLVGHYLGWIGVALLLGLAVGWVGAERPRSPARPNAVLLVLFGVALAIWIAFMHVLPGRVGHGFEILLVLGVGYVFGCCIGEPLRLALAPPSAVRASSSGSRNEIATPPAFAAFADARLAGQGALMKRRDNGSVARLEPPLSAIAGIGPLAAGRLASMGVTNIREIANWSRADAEFVAERMGEPGRVEREMWIAQARLLAGGVETSHSIALRMNRIPAAEQDAPLDDERIARLRTELEDLSEAAGLNAFSFAMPQIARAFAEASAHAREPVADEHKPLMLAAPPAQGADDLKLIWGVGPKLEHVLNEMGIYRFDQIAAWSEMNLRWMDQNLAAFHGCAARDRWIEQSRKLARGWRPDNEGGEKFAG